jgi:hypothetical protein
MIAEMEWRCVIVKCVTAKERSSEVTRRIINLTSRTFAASFLRGKGFWCGRAALGTFGFNQGSGEHWQDANATFIIPPRHGAYSAFPA